MIGQSTLFTVINTNHQNSVSSMRNVIHSIHWLHFNSRLWTDWYEVDLNPDNSILVAVCLSPPHVTVCCAYACSYPSFLQIDIDCAAAQDSSTDLVPKVKIDRKTCWWWLMNSQPIPFPQHIISYITLKQLTHNNKKRKRYEVYPLNTGTD